MLFREHEKVAETFRQCTFSFDTLLLFLILVGVIAQEAPKTLKWPSGCAHLLVPIGRPPKRVAARKFTEFFLFFLLNVALKKAPNFP